MRYISVDVIQMIRGAPYVGRRELSYVFVKWGKSVYAGGLRVLEVRIQGCSELVEGGGGRRARR